ncbi:hypothetical protein CEXT_229461 [Caerostris extrusa]|uniref:Uncharacterized protein n=1 Tax=Caerostris extrusa TaxID=172846 RepID=A0AAV4XB56_CAEEX|nr:hypothetical protein CEXT_229461 [Caerostris extrusa]
MRKREFQGRDVPVKLNANIPEEEDYLGEGGNFKESMLNSRVPKLERDAGRSSGESHVQITPLYVPNSPSMGNEGRELLSSRSFRCT